MALIAAMTSRHGPPRPPDNPVLRWDLSPLSRPIRTAVLDRSLQERLKGRAITYSHHPMRLCR